MATTTTTSSETKIMFCLFNLPAHSTAVSDRPTPSRQQIFDLHRQFPHPNSGSVMYCFGNRSGNTGKSDLADPASPEFIDLLVRVIKKMHINRRRVRVHRHHVVSKVA